MKLNLLFVFIFNFLTLSEVFCQAKKNIDFDAIDKWTDVQHPSISPNGNFTAYVVDNGPLKHQTLTIQSIGSSWKRQLISRRFDSGVTFSTDSRYAIFNLGNDSLGVIHLGTSEIEYIPNASNFTVLKNGNLTCIIYDLIGSPKKSVIYNLKTREKYVLECENFLLSPDGQHLLAKSKTMVDNVEHYTVNWYDLKSKKRITIWEGADARDFKFTASGDKLAFLVNKPLKGGSNNQGSSVYLFFSDGVDTVSHIICSSNELPMSGGYTINSLEGFSKDGLRLYFKCLEKKAVSRSSSTNAEVDVWSFNDTKLKSDNRKPKDDILSVIHLSGKKIYPLTLPGEDYWGFDRSNPADFSCEYLLTRFTESGVINEQYWNQTCRSRISVVSTITGARKEVGSNLGFGEMLAFNLSPNGKYILYYDGKTNNYFSYSVPEGTRTNLTENIQAEWYIDKYKIQKKQELFPRGIIGWIKNTNDALIQEKYDIWRISLDGSKAPICITNKYGQKHHIKFYIYTLSDLGKTILDDGSELILSAFNSFDKKNGFYAVDVKGNRSDPKQLIMDDFNYFIPNTQGIVELLKAENAKAWIVGKQRYNESPNFYYTKDFINFKVLTNNHPEKDYNWLTAELVNWKLPDNTTSQGILYKPENFDPNKKYPVIFQYYEELSDGLNVFLRPERSVCTINIPYYVSNGYLVFTPDIKRTKDGAGQDALNTMVSAAKHLSTFPYIDPARLGLCGHSMGGYKTNYIVTHSNLFAAANSSSGISNISSWGLGISNGGHELAAYIEISQFYIGYSIAERPDLYVKNSPIFFVKNVQTPLLMMYNKIDHSNWTDGVAIFNALRRAGKPTWMLQYDKQGHYLDDSDTIATTDLTIRQKQFFDHYLMGQPAPKWMTRGISVEMKQIDDGFELDTEIKTPVGRLLTPEAKKWQADAEKLAPFTVTIK